MLRTWASGVVAGALVMAWAGLASAADAPAAEKGDKTDMAKKATKLDTLFLWPAGAPEAKGDKIEDKPRLTPYLLDGDGPFGCVIVCPGGGYGGRAGHEAGPIAEWLNTAGVSAFVLDYRVAPYKHPVPLMDAQRAIGLGSAEATEGLRRHLVNVVGLTEGQTPEEAIEMTYRRLGEAPSLVLLATLEDAAAARQRPNLPGTIAERPNWSLALPHDLDALESSELPRRIAKSLAEG